MLILYLRNLDRNYQISKDYNSQDDNVNPNKSIYNLIIIHHISVHRYGKDIAIFGLISTRLSGIVSHAWKELYEKIQLRNFFR